MDNLVFSNMMHRPARTVVSVLGIAIGVLLIVFTVGLANGSLREQAKRESNVGAQFFFCASGASCYSGSNAFQLPVSKRSEIEKVPGVGVVMPLGQTSVNAKTAQGKRLVDGVIFDEYASMTGIRIIEGKNFEDDTDQVVIDTAFQRQEKLKIGDQITIWERSFTVVGTYEPAVGARVKMPLLTMQKQVNGKESPPDELNRVSSFLIRTKDGASEDVVGEAIATEFPKNQLIRTRDLEELYLNSIPALGIFLNVIIGVAATISALVILLTMYTTVTERTRQIGILKSLGMPNSKVAWIITQEALLITFCGIITGILSTVLLRQILINVTNLQVELDYSLLGITLIVGLVGGALGALYPALRAARLDAVEALSYE